jgi:hypothetical protein
MDTSTNKPTRKGRDHYSHAIADAKKARRQSEADARQAKYDALSIVERLNLAYTRPGKSNREITRLTAKLHALGQTYTLPAKPATKAATPKASRQRTKKKTAVAA